MMSSPLPALLMPSLPHFGLVRGLTGEGYRACGGLSCSGLKLMSRSPAHYYAWVRDERAPVVERSGQLEGTLAHCLILEPGEYPFRYAVGPEVSRATREWKTFEAAHPLHTCIKPSQAAAAQAQAASVRQHPEVAKLLSRGEPEVSAFWTDSETRVSCQCRPDWVYPVDGKGVILLDVKTCGDAGVWEFSRQIARKHYHWQAAWYTDGYSIAAQTPVLGFVFVTVESEWPYAASAFMLDEESLDIARKEIRPLVKLYQECDASNQWPGYPPIIEQIELPRWYAERVETAA